MEGASGCTNHPLSRGSGDGSLGGTLPTEDVVLGEHERARREGAFDFRGRSVATEVSEARS